jgi:hypothetical protein
MLATVAALQLLFLAQASAPPAPVPPDEPPAAAPEERAPGTTGAPDEATRERGATPPAEEAPRSAGTATPGAGVRPPSPATASARPPLQSLLSAESLRGGSAAFAWAGWSEIGAMYAIGFTARDDAGVYLSYDWAKSENRLGVLYRRPLSKAGPFDMAARLSLAFYSNFGADYVYDDNRSDRGFEVVPGLSLSRPAAGGILSGIAEAPMTVTGKYETGFLFSPRASLAFETLLYPTMSVGARVGLGYRAGAGGAPLKEGRGEVQFLLLAGYQLL